jgi:hypothetical protein
MFPLDFVKYRIILYDPIVHVKNALKQTLRFLMSFWQTGKRHLSEGGKEKLQYAIKGIF